MSRYDWPAFFEGNSAAEIIAWLSEAPDEVVTFEELQDLRAWEESENGGRVTVIRAIDDRYVEEIVGDGGTGTDVAPEVPDVAPKVTDATAYLATRRIWLSLKPPKKVEPGEAVPDEFHEGNVERLLAAGAIEAA